MSLSPEAAVGQSRREQLLAGLERNHCWPRTQELTSLLFLVSLLLPQTAGHVANQPRLVPKARGAILNAPGWA